MRWVEVSGRRAPSNLQEYRVAPVDRLVKVTGWPVSAVGGPEKSATSSTVGSRTRKLWTMDTVRAGSEPERSVPWTLTS